MSSFGGFLQSQSYGHSFGERRHMNFAKCSCSTVWGPLKWEDPRSSAQISVRVNTSGKGTLQENASAAHRDLEGIRWVVLTSCRRSPGNRETSSCNRVQRSWFSEWLEKANAALSRSAGLRRDFVERYTSPKGLGKRNAYKATKPNGKYKKRQTWSLASKESAQTNFTWARCYRKSST